MSKIVVLGCGYSQMGISPPEFVGRVKGCRERVEEYLKDRGVHCKLRVGNRSKSPN